MTSIRTSNYSVFVTLHADTGSLKLGQDKFGADEDEAGSAVVPAAAPPAPQRPVYDGPLPSAPQKAFQPGSTPAHLTHRFMVGPSEDRLMILEQGCPSI